MDSSNSPQDITSVQQHPIEREPIANVGSTENAGQGLRGLEDVEIEEAELHQEILAPTQSVEDTVSTGFEFDLPTDILTDLDMDAYSDFSEIPQPISMDDERFESTDIIVSLGQPFNYYLGWIVLIISINNIPELNCKSRYYNNVQTSPFHYTIHVHPTESGSRELAAHSQRHSIIVALRWKKLSAETIKLEVQAEQVIGCRVITDTQMFYVRKMTEKVNKEVKRLSVILP
ncbi:hypothetical protein JR316_0009761 [Psilocybe cubensis]|uniref:Uncharacterized protein n=2 Tax=Psilocybe cubensis TaxID=181762 RepID=A0A8H7XPT3_PSICU|nr:hypothetical protein JR316_0009761 [Psilocybe cubensis]KAH9477539.1 hypothetical protein JR316_0009761 [Psilocybe cubensis]